MDSQRTLLMIALVFVGLLMYQAWQHDYGQTPQTAHSAAPGTAAPAGNQPSDVPQLLTTPAGEKAPAAAPATPATPDNSVNAFPSDSASMWSPICWT